ncbi:LysM peptidoglycan-binding domain-containing protein [Paenibacillaceae bacterium WGS1546]|uniref:LysM peptidoglycan-binding domain-containing protein n=1 Tax=Cohnella sp. WGS1546 TaxID=3366810 RepID=UPI00372D5A46
MVHSWITVGTASSSTIHRKCRPVAAPGAGRADRRALKSGQAVRSLFMLLAFLILFSGFSMMRTAASPQAVSPAAKGELVISVDSGDTLWEIARTHTVVSMDTRQAVHAIMERNALRSASLKPGQELILPASLLT